MSKIEKLPFDAQIASMDNAPEVKVKTRDGRPARVVCIDANDHHPVVAIVDGQALHFDMEGHSEDSPDLDLEFAVDNDAIVKHFGCDPFAAAALASEIFGDPKQYSSEEMEVISMITMSMTAK